MIRMAYVDTSTSGMGLDVTTLQGPISARTYPPHGVIVSMGGKDHEVTANALAEMGRFFLAAAVHCGEPISD